MDVPYDPACPLLIDSDDESIVSGDGDIEKRYDDLLSRKKDGQYSSNATTVGKKMSSEPRFVPAFEDDNEELLNYCLKESGFLTDDETEKKPDHPLVGDDEGGKEKETNAEMPCKEDKKLEFETRISEKEFDREIDTKEKSHKKKKKQKTKEKCKESKDRRGRSTSFELMKEKKSKKDSIRRDREDKSGVKARENNEHNKKKIKHSNQTDIIDRDNDHDDDKLFAVLGENDSAFPLSKSEHDHTNKMDYKEESKRYVKDKHKKEKLIDKAKKRKVEDSEEEKKIKKKRHRSRSSHRRTAKSSESDEPDKKRKKKKKHRDSSTENSQHRYEKKRNIADDKRRKSDGKSKEESNRKHKKKKRSHGKDDERKPSYHKRDHRERKDSQASHEKSHLYHETTYSKQNKSERKRHYESESMLRRKEGSIKHEQRNDNRKEKSGKQSESLEKKGRHSEGIKQDEKRNVQSDMTVKTSNSNISSHSEKELKPEAKAMDREGTGNNEIVQNHVDGENKVMEAKEKDIVLLSDTDSEFDRLSDIEREMDIKNYDDSFSSPDKSSVIKQEDDTDLGGKNQKDKDSNVNNENDCKDTHEIQQSNVEYHEKDDYGISEKGEINEEDEPENLASDCLQSSSSDSLQGHMEQSNTQDSKQDSRQDSKIHEKRPFKLFSQEETKKLHKELLSKDKEEGNTEEAGSMEDGNESSDKMKDDIKEEEVVMKDEGNMISEVIELQSDNEVPRADEVDVIGQKYAQKSKDDLFDDIFAKQDSEIKHDYDIAQMYEKVEDTSPRRLSFNNQKSVVDGNQFILRSGEKEGELGPSSTKESSIKKEGGAVGGKEKRSPKEESPQRTIIPGLEPVSIPGLESTEIKEENKIGGFDKPTMASSRIPLLFDGDTGNEKSHQVPKTAEFLPSPKMETKRKQPYTPPEEFIGETENNQFDRYYHVEASESPYNPEDLTPIDMGLTPSDANIIQQEALRGTVELKLKDPFSGFENPTWQKIIEAKSKHETKRQRDKVNDPTEKSNERASKDQPKSSKQDKLMNMLVRQSRVEQECKEVLKLYYKSKEITKDEYKNILRKAVPQVTLSNSPIIPEKIRSLMKKFVCKCKGQRLMSGHAKPARKKRKMPKTESLSHELTLPGEKRFRYLNPDLPMPPV